MNKLTRILFKTLAVLLLILFMLWAFSPHIIGWIIRTQLPANWQLVHLDINRPGIDGIEVLSVNISSPGQNIDLEKLHIPYSSSKTIQLKKLKINLHPDSSENSSEPFFPQPINFERSVNIDSLFIKHEKFELQGSLETSSEAASFKGTLLSEQKTFPLEANALGINGLQHLNLSVKLGSNQFFTLEYPWKEKSQAQEIQIIANIEQQLWQMLTESKLLPLPETLQIQQPQFAISVKLGWQQWPANEEQFLAAHFNGQAQFKFSELTFNDWTATGNLVELSFDNNGELLVSSESPVHLQQNINQQSVDVAMKQLQQLPVSLKNSKLSILKPGIIKTNFDGHEILITPTNINYDFTTKILSLNSDFNVNINPEIISPFAKINNNTQMVFRSSGYFEISDKQLKVDLQPSTLDTDSGIQFQHWRLDNSQIVLEPFSKSFLFEDDFSLESIYQTDASGLLTASIDSPTLRLNNQCSWSKIKQLVKLKCETQSEKSTTEKIITKINFNLDHKILDTTISTENISAKNWSLEDIVPEELKLTSFQLATMINLKIPLSKLPDMNIEEFLNQITSNSYVTMNNLNFNYQDIFVKDGLIQMDSPSSKRLVFSLTAAEVVLSSDLKLSAIHGIIKPLQTTPDKVLSKTNLNHNLSLDFKIFDADISISSDDFSVFKTNYQLKTSVHQLDLGKLLKWLDISGLDGTGKMDGSFPVSVNEDGFSLSNGLLHSTNDGVIRYQVSGSKKTASNIALDSLKNFHYKELSAKIEQLNLFYHKQGNFLIPLRFVGKNPQSQFDNLFAINPKLQGIIPAETWSQLIVGNLQESVKNQAKLLQEK